MKPERLRPGAAAGGPSVLSKSPQKCLVAESLGTGSFPPRPETASPTRPTSRGANSAQLSFRRTNSQPATGKDPSRPPTAARDGAYRAAEAGGDAKEKAAITAWMMGADAPRQYRLFQKLMGCVVPLPSPPVPCFRAWHSGVHVAVVLSDNRNLPSALPLVPSCPAGAQGCSRFGRSTTSSLILSPRTTVYVAGSARQAGADLRRPRSLRLVGPMCLVVLIHSSPLRPVGRFLQREARQAPLFQACQGPMAGAT